MDNKGGKGKLRWKPILAVLLILGIFGFFLTTSFGKSLFGNLGTGFGGLSGFISQPKPAGSGFAITLASSPGDFIGQKFSVTNASFNSNGTYNLLKVGDQSFISKTGNNLLISVLDFTGTIQFTSGGSISLVGTSDYVELGDLVSSSSKLQNVQMDIIPTTATIGGLNQNTIHFDGISGNLNRSAGVAVDSVTLSGGKLDISDFSGTLTWKANGINLAGIVSSVKGETFTFV